jgi:hypothetical protein
MADQVLNSAGLPWRDDVRGFTTDVLRSQILHGEMNSRARLSDETIRAMREHVNAFPKDTYAKVGELFGCKAAHVAQIVNGYTRSSAGGPIKRRDRRVHIESYLGWTWGKWRCVQDLGTQDRVRTIVVECSCENRTRRKLRPSELGPHKTQSCGCYASRRRSGFREWTPAEEALLRDMWL